MLGLECTCEIQNDKCWRGWMQVYHILTNTKQAQMLVDSARRWSSKRIRWFLVAFKNQWELPKIPNLPPFPRSVLSLWPFVKEIIFHAYYFSLGMTSWLTVHVHKNLLIVDLLRIRIDCLPSLTPMGMLPPVVHAIVGQAESLPIGS